MGCKVIRENGEKKMRSKAREIAGAEGNSWKGKITNSEAGLWIAGAKRKIGGVHSERKYCRYKSRDGTPAIRSR